MMVAGVGVGGVAVIRTVEGSVAIVVRLLVIVALLAFTALCARAALLAVIHHDVQPRPSGPPERPVLLCNPWSGGGKVGRFGIVELAAEIGVESVILDHGVDLETLARDAVARGADCLGMAGVTGRKLSSRLSLSNTVCRSFASVLERATTSRSIWAWRPRTHVNRWRHSAMRTSGASTSTPSTIGSSSTTSRSVPTRRWCTKRHIVKPSWRWPRRSCRRSSDAKPRRSTLQFTTPDGRDVDGAIVVMVSNNPYTMNAVAPDAAERRHFDRGELGVFAVTTRTGGEAARLFTAAALGGRLRSRFWHEFLATDFEVRSRSGVALAGIDGESVELKTPLRFRTHPKGLTLLVPNGNIEAAQRRERETFA